MKTIITLSALALLSNLALAESFNHEQQIASPDLSNQDFSSSDPMPSSKDVRVSLHELNRDNPDIENVAFNHDAVLNRGSTQFTAYDELSRQNPDLGGV